MTFKKLEKLINKAKKKKNNKTPYFNYLQENLERALHAVKKGLPIRSAAKQFNVPFSTIRCKAKGIYALGKRSGPSTILSEAEEQRLVDWIHLVGSKGFPLTKPMLLDSVQLLIKELKRKNPFTKGRPGRHWLEGFLKRHKELSIRTPQNLNQRRAEVTEERLRGWYSEVRDYLKEKQILDIDGSRIFNCDETAFFLNPKGNKVIVNKKSKSVYNLVGADEKECLTTLITGNASGQLLPPLIMFSYQRLPANITENVPSSWSIGRSDSGWMTGESFFEYIANIFHPWCIQNQIEFPVIMYLDGHSSHATMALSDFCVANEIELISLFPNSTHLIQPMDVAIFRPLKDAWKSAVLHWKIENNGQSIKKSDFANVLKNAIESIDMKNSLENGFSCCGLSPFSADAVDYSRILNNEQPLNQENKNLDALDYLTNKNEYTIMLKMIESSLSTNTIQLFKTAESTTEEWLGEEKYHELYSFWLKCRKLVKSNNQDNVVQESCNIKDTNL